MSHINDDAFLDLANVTSRLAEAVTKFNAREYSLLQRDPSERSLTHRFAVYLESVFGGWDVDCEYNRDGFDAKSLDLPIANNISADETTARTVFPDIVVHRRGAPLNLLVLEAKKAHARNRGLDDRIKLRAFIAQLHYRYGAVLTFQTRDEPLCLLPAEFIRADV